MDDFMVWLYFHYIMPTLEEASKGDFAEPINRLRSQLDVCQEWIWTISSNTTPAALFSWACVPAPPSRRSRARMRFPISASKVLF